jgi:hypothetical protein
VTADAGDVRVVAPGSGATPGERGIAAPEEALAGIFGLLCVIRARYGARSLNLYTLCYVEVD